MWNYHDADAPGPAETVRVAIDGLPPGIHRVLLTHFRIDETHSNAYTLWQSLGSPQHPTPEQFARLQAAGQLQLLTSPEWLEVVEGRVQLSSTLPRQGVSLLHLTWP